MEAAVAGADALERRVNGRGSGEPRRGNESLRAKPPRKEICLGLHSSRRSSSSSVSTSHYLNQKDVKRKDSSSLGSLDLSKRKKVPSAEPVVASSIECLAAGSNALVTTGEAWGPSFRKRDGLVVTDADSVIMNPEVARALVSAFILPKDLSSLGRHTRERLEDTQDHLLAQLLATSNALREVGRSVPDAESRLATSQGELKRLHLSLSDMESELTRTKEELALVRSSKDFEVGRIKSDLINERREYDIRLAKEFLKVKRLKQRFKESSRRRLLRHRKFMHIEGFRMYGYGFEDHGRDVAARNFQDEASLLSFLELSKEDLDTEIGSNSDFADSEGEVSDPSCKSIAAVDHDCIFSVEEVLKFAEDALGDPPNEGCSTAAVEGQVGNDLDQSSLRTCEVGEGDQAQES
ncbi:hypothetical protein EZV62_012225 [Acer yangbiense]|uniref:Uncharacterized protein n=1 Tax=Acer yangbiense TaxID=1000413 RepID=A0A5C7HXH6_9ROSI|nr:hypothetical protein EZV62_012225 [Acer yangbiense]